MRRKQKTYIGIIFIAILLIILGINIYKIENKKSKNQTTHINNAFIISGDQSGIKAFVDGRQVEYKVSGLDDRFNNCIADLEVVDGYVKTIFLKQDVITGKVLSIGDGMIYIEGYGTLKLSDDHQIYNFTKNMTMGNVKDINLGYDNARFFVDGDKICGVVIGDEINPNNIRVLINATDFKSKYHSSVSVSCDGDYIITYDKGKKSRDVKGGEVTNIDYNSELFDSGDVKISPAAANSKISLLSVKRTLGTPQYAGTLSLARRDEGILLINEVNVEDYVKGVVASEMPHYFGEKALEVQAICARTYAFRQIKDRPFAEYGAHLDDSTSSQVYNNVKSDKDTIAAVENTVGQVIEYDGDPIQAFFFSTSAGVTTTDDIWGNDNQPYLTSHSLGEEITYNLKNNDDFAAFIKSDFKAYDSEYPLYRWHVKFSSGEIENAVNNITKIDIGDVTSINITNRGDGGIVTNLEVNGTNGSAPIENEIKIRQMFNCTGKSVTLKDKSVRTDIGLLPSAYITIDKDSDGGYTVYGGGYGHGVGLSQNGTKGMLDAGKTKEEVIDFFYPGTTIADMYKE